MDQSVTFWKRVYRSSRTIKLLTRKSILLSEFYASQSLPFNLRTITESLGSFLNMFCEEKQTDKSGISNYFYKQTECDKKLRRKPCTLLLQVIKNKYYFTQIESIWNLTFFHKEINMINTRPIVRFIQTQGKSVWIEQGWYHTCIDRGRRRINLKTIIKTGLRQKMILKNDNEMVIKTLVGVLLRDETCVVIKCTEWSPIALILHAKSWVRRTREEIILKQDNYDTSFGSTDI